MGIFLLRNEKGTTVLFLRNEERNAFLFSRLERRTECVTFLSNERGTERVPKIWGTAKALTISKTNMKMAKMYRKFWNVIMSALRCMLSKDYELKATKKAIKLGRPIWAIIRIFEHLNSREKVLFWSFWSKIEFSRIFVDSVWFELSIKSHAKRYQK